MEDPRGMADSSGKGQSERAIKGSSRCIFFTSELLLGLSVRRLVAPHYGKSWAVIFKIVCFLTK
jgi:hypothetical protein